MSYTRLESHFVKTTDTTLQAVQLVISNVLPIRYKQYIGSDFKKNGNFFQVRDLIEINH